MVYKVIVNENFTDAYTGKEYKAGERVEFSENRVKEIQAVKKDLISPFAKVEKKATKKSDENKGE